MLDLHLNIYDMKINPLVKFGNVPVQTGTIAACYDYLLSPSEKIRALELDIWSNDYFLQLADRIVFKE